MGGDELDGREYSVRLSKNALCRAFLVPGIWTSLTFHHSISGQLIGFSAYLWWLRSPHRPLAPTKDSDQSPRTPSLSGTGTCWPRQEAAGVADAMIKAPLVISWRPALTALLTAMPGAAMLVLIVGIAQAEGP